MKRVVVWVIAGTFTSVVLLVVACPRAPGLSTAPTATPSAQSSSTPNAAALAPLQCNSTLWDHTYTKSRFTVYSLCITETVTVTASAYSNDGDLDADATDANGKYVAIEIPCQRSPTSPEAINAHVCDGLVPATARDVLVPGLYDVAGPNVWDTRHNWREIHGAVVRLRNATDTSARVHPTSSCIVCQADDE